MISCKIFLQLMVTVFKYNPPLLFYSSIMLVIETVFISEQITEYIGALFEISDKFITKLNVMSHMILQLRLQTVCRIS